ncbi:MAG: dicarboxylate/amino acid:cation symporter [Caulobacter sp.]|nr:dicarboxylate/amino acid:cation symporter [Caulobacter sp.]
MSDPSERPPSPSSPLARYWFEIKLWKRILVALALGVVVGLAWGEGATKLHWMGELFIRLIRMMVVPLVFVTIASGVAALGDIKRLGSLGLRTIGLFAALSATAVCVGLAVGSVIQPGVGANMAGAAPQVINAGKTVSQQLLGIVPINPVEALAKGDMLAIIFFSVMIGVGVVAAGKSAEPVTAVLKGASDVTLRVVRMVMEVAPFGVFGLIASAVGSNGLAVFVNVGLLALAVVIASAFQTLVVHGLLIRLVAGLPIKPFFTGIADAMLVGFSTSSSSATLPVAVSVAENNLGLKGPIISTVLPLGASIGRDGTALYVGLLALFTAQAFGMHLAPVDYLLILLTATLVALGTAPVPSASLFMLAAVLSVIGVPDSQTAIIVGFILPFDRVLDMIRTVPNATTNLATATTVARWENEIDLTVYNSPPRE